jgi:hypothetical protein
VASGVLIMNQEPSLELLRAAHETLGDHVDLVNRLGVIPHSIRGSILFAVWTRHASALSIKGPLAGSGECQYAKKRAANYADPFERANLREALEVACRIPSPGPG